MEYRFLGNTGLRVSAIALGCGGLEGMPQEDATRLIRAAMDRGVNFFDLYSPDPVLRDSVGAALAGGRDRLIVQGHLGAVWQDGQYLRTRDLAPCKAAFSDLLDRLGTTYIDVGMIHYVDSVADWETVSSGAFSDWVRELKDSGRIRHIGLGSHNPEVALRAAESGWIEVLMFAVNPCYDMQPAGEDMEKLWADESYAGALHNQDAQRKRLYELCDSRGVGIDVMKAYGGGDLLQASLSPFGKAFTPVQCLHYALTRPAVAAVMCGCKTEQELDTALSYLTADACARDYSDVLSGLDRFTFSGHCLYCGHCAPCPAGIDVAAVARLLNLCTAQGRVPETERGHYAELGHHAGECLSCGGCESRCPFGVPAMENMTKAARLFGR